jgi:hypothetical protein
MAEGGLFPALGSLDLQVRWERGGWGGEAAAMMVRNGRPSLSSPPRIVAAHKDNSLGIRKKINTTNS